MSDKLKPKLMICPNAKKCRDIPKCSLGKPHPYDDDCNKSIMRADCPKCVAVKPSRWKPEHGGEEYYAIVLARRVYTVNKVVYCKYGEASTIDTMNGNYFRTKREAEAMLKEIIKLMRGSK